MGTSDIPLEKIHALLKVDAGNGAMYDHLVRVVRKLAEDKPSDALAQIESLSFYLKSATFRGVCAPDEGQPFVTDAEGEEKRLQHFADILKLVRPPSDPTAAPKVLAVVNNFMEDAAMLAWAGVGFGQQESYHISMSLRKLASETPALENLRFWGKVLGTQGDYYIAEGELQKLPTTTPPLPALPGTPEYDVEPRGEGTNTCVYWVSTGGGAPWSRLPAARASHIKASRLIKKMLTGDLAASVDSMPWFPGKEAHLLRSQIARITASCKLAPNGYYEADEDAGANKIKITEGAMDSFPVYADLERQETWQHCAPVIHLTGKTGWPDIEAWGESLGEEQKEAVTKILEQEQDEEGENKHPILKTIDGDLEELKGEDAEGGSPAWSVKVFGDKGVYKFPEDEKSHRVVGVRSLIWPGAVTAAQGKKYANIYIGYALKCGTLVPQQKDTGLPLRGTCPFTPLVPDDIMDEPQDLEELEEPNPQDEDVASNAESVEPDEDA